MGWFSKKAPPPSGPDYSTIDSSEKAQGLVAKGDLVALQLLPTNFGGDDNVANFVFVPPFVADLKNQIDENTVLPLVQQGKVTRYWAEPEYWGRSFVPIAIKIVAEDPASFTYDVAIWGEALRRPLG